jgi:hypothetical protein
LVTGGWRVTSPLLAQPGPGFESSPPRCWACVRNRAAGLAYRHSGTRPPEMTLCSTHESRRFMRCLFREAKDPFPVWLTEVTDCGASPHTACLIIQGGPMQTIVRIRVAFLELTITEPGTPGEETQ